MRPAPGFTLSTSLVIAVVWGNTSLAGRGPKPLLAAFALHVFAVLVLAPLGHHESESAERIYGLTCFGGAFGHCLLIGCVLERCLS